METKRQTHRSKCDSAVGHWILLGLLVLATSEVVAKPRVMSDAEMDEVCAKGTEGIEVSMVSVQEIMFQVQKQTSLGKVSSSGTLKTEFLPTSSSSQITTTASASALGTGVSPLQIQITGGTVRMLGDVNVTVDALPRALRALENRLLLPGGLTANSVLRSLGGNLGN